MLPPIVNLNRILIYKELVWEANISLRPHIIETHECGTHVKCHNVATAMHALRSKVWLQVFSITEIW